MRWNLCWWNLPKNWGNDVITPKSTGSYNYCYWQFIVQTKLIRLSGRIDWAVKVSLHSHSNVDSHYIRLSKILTVGKLHSHAFTRPAENVRQKESIALWLEGRVHTDPLCNGYSFSFSVKMNLALNIISLYYLLK